MLAERNINAAIKQIAKELSIQVDYKRTAVNESEDLFHVPFTPALTFLFTEIDRNEPFSSAEQFLNRHNSGIHQFVK